MLGIFIRSLALATHKAFKRKICIYSGMWHECVCAHVHVPVHEMLLMEQRAPLNFNVDSICTLVHSRTHLCVCMCVYGPTKTLPKNSNKIVWHKWIQNGMERNRMFTVCNVSNHRFVYHFIIRSGWHNRLDGPKFNAC